MTLNLTKCRAPDSLGDDLFLHLSNTDQVDFPTVEPWRVGEDTQAKVPLVLSGFEQDAIISVHLVVRHGRIWAADSDEAVPIESVAEAVSNMTLTGTQGDINSAVESVWYSAPPDWNSRGQESFETLSVLVDEQEPTHGGDPYPGVPRTLVVLVVPINDRPSLQGPPGFTVVEGATTVLAGIEVFDVDADDTDGGRVEVSVSAPEAGSVVGLDSMFGLFVKESSDASMTFQGTLKNVNRALEGLTFRGPFEFSGVTELKVSVDDMGNTGEGGLLSASLSVPIHITSLNNPPRVVREQGLILNGVENKAIRVDGIVVADQDAGDGRLRMTIEARYGKLSFGRIYSGVEFEEEGGLPDGTSALRGTVEVRTVNPAMGSQQAICLKCKVDGQLESVSSRSWITLHAHTPSRAAFV